VPQMLRGLGGGRPVYLIAEDLHLADESSLNLLHLLARGAASIPLMVVATCRDDEVLAGTPVHMFLSHVDSERLARGVRLPRLHLEATRSILADVLPAEPSDGFAAHVHRVTDGNPFYVEQLARSFRELGRLETAEGPAAVVRSRVARLGRKAQPLLSAGAVLGTRIDYELLRALTGLSGHDLLQGIEPCLEARILAADGDTYRFRHSLLRDAVYE
jgi:predicted ATPase